MLAVAAVLLSSFLTARAAGGPTPSFGVAVVPFTGGWPALTASFTLPVTTLASREGPVALAARLDATAQVDFALPPDVGVSALSVFYFHDQLNPYLGLGAALAWRAGAAGPEGYVTPTVLAGLRLRVSDEWAARFEAVVAPFVPTVAVSLGVEVSPWAR